jgi:hypothetical protein
MPYYLDFSTQTLDFLEKRLLEEDLIPSHLPLREGLSEHLAALRNAGISDLSELDRQLGKTAGIQRISAVTGISTGYLKVLSRVLRGYRPKAAVLAEYPYVVASEISLLAGQGIRDSYDLWTRAASRAARRRLGDESGIPEGELASLVCLSDLSRIQWVSPVFARLLFDAGYRTTADVAAANKERLAADVAAVNQQKMLFRGKIGLRDMGRLTYLASMLPHELEL